MNNLFEGNHTILRPLLTTSAFFLVGNMAVSLQIQKLIFAVYGTSNGITPYPFTSGAVSWSATNFWISDWRRPTGVHRYSRMVTVTAIVHTLIRKTTGLYLSPVRGKCIGLQKSVGSSFNKRAEDLHNTLCTDNMHPWRFAIFCIDLSVELCREQEGAWSARVNLHWCTMGCPRRLLELRRVAGLVLWWWRGIISWLVCLLGC